MRFIAFPRRLEVRSMMMTCNTILAISIAFILQIANPDPATPITDANDPKVQYQLKLEKSKAENLAVQVMRIYDPNTDVYKEANRLYTDAQQKFNAYTSTLLTMLRSGVKSDISEIANEASIAARRFSDYVNEKIEASRSPALIPSVTAALLDIVERLWGLYSKETTARRAALAAELEPKITWSTWKQLSTGD